MFLKGRDMQRRGIKFLKIEAENNVDCVKTIKIQQKTIDSIQTLAELCIISALEWLQALTRNSR